MVTARGKQGERGERGQRGERGPAGQATTPPQILAAVQAEFDHIQQQLQVLQSQLDAIHGLLKRALGGATNQSDPR